MNIVTGYTGTPHITANEAQALNQGIFGSGNYVLDVGSKFGATLENATTVAIQDGEGVIQGVQFRIAPGSVETVAISPGTSGYKRIDYICARYTKSASTGVESVDLVVVEGTPAASTPTAPTINTGDVLNGAPLVDFPLWEVDIDGLTPTLIPLFPAIQSIDSMQIPQKNCELTGTYINFGLIFYTIYKGFLIFSAAVIPSQTITTAIGTVTIADNIGSFDGNAPYFVSAGGSNSNDTSVKLAWCQSGTHSFRIVGAFTQGTTYYFGGIARII